MAEDRRYLNRKGPYWYAQLSVPADLREKLGRAVIQRSLRTKDLAEARRRRWPVIEEIKKSFEAARAGLHLTSEDIATEAQEELWRTLEAIRRDPGTLFEEVPEQGLLGWASVWALEDDLVDENYSAVEKEVQRILLRRGVQVSSEQREKLALALLLARREALAAALKVRESTLQPPARTRTVRDAFAFFSDAAERFEAERQGTWAAKTAQQFRVASRLFGEYIGDVPLLAVTRDDAAAFLREIARLRPDYGRDRRAKYMPLLELLRQYAGPPGLSRTTLRRHAIVLHGFFEWARDRGYYPASNPFAGLPGPN